MKLCTYKGKIMPYSARKGSQENLWYYEGVSKSFRNHPKTYWYPSYIYVKTIKLFTLTNVTVSPILSTTSATASISITPLHTLRILRTSCWSKASNRADVPPRIPLRRNHNIDEQWWADGKRFGNVSQWNMTLWVMTIYLSIYPVVLSTVGAPQML